MLAIRIVLVGVCLLCLAASRAAATIDLTTLDARGVSQGVIYTQGEASATSSLQFQPFLRVQATGVEQGFNSDFRPLEPDAIGTPPFNHSLLLSSLSRELITTPTSTQYVYEFHMDVNETITSGQNYLSIDQLRLYVASSPSIATAANLAVTGTLLYDLDAAGDETLLLDSALEPGSGIPELTIQVPTEMFQNVPIEVPYLYVFFRAGGMGLMGGRNYAAAGGFEEVLANVVSSPTGVEAEAVPAAAPWIRVVGGPSTEQVRFRFAAPPGDVTISIYDVRGRAIASYRGAGGSAVRDVRLTSFARSSHLGSGVYFYRFTAQGVTRATGKVALVR